ncbi:MAG: tRNA (adenosine(37)-N6)-threonylcarbamoyltransferase complex dimerization subunit type 1 TsaB [Verrucomicrobiota bacterium]
MLLAIDASTSITSWATQSKDGTITEFFLKDRASSALAASLQKHRDLLTEVEEIIVGVGPGSFSGIRVAVATAQGLSTVWNASIRGVRSSNALAWKMKHVSYLGVFADARRHQYFFTPYKEGALIEPTQVLDTKLLEDYLSKCSLAISAEKDANIPESVSLSAGDLIRHDCNFGPEKKSLILEPIHLRPSITLKK